MDKIQIVNILDGEAKSEWSTVLERIKKETNNFSVDSMCELCIKDQLAQGVFDEYGNPTTTIQCKGVSNFKNNTISKYGEEVYNLMLDQLSPEQIRAAEQANNAIEWLESEIDNPKLFSPREYQRMVVSCTSNRKVLRMGRRAGKTFSMVVGLLHRALSEDNYRVLMIAPMETMITEVVEQIVKFCKEMEVNPIVRQTQQPIHLIEFSNGSTFKGVTAGASGAKGARGKGADLLYVDECFPGKTKIRVSEGQYKNIADIKKGDRVLSYDDAKDSLVYKTVKEARCTGKKDIYTYTTVSGKKINCTQNHPVLTTEGWKPITEAKNIATIKSRVGDYFFESIVSEVYKNSELTYNFEVRDTHTYIADDFIVHNCDFLSPKDFNSILGILMDDENTEFWASSTPIGETNLYKLSLDKSFKEFHLPSFVIPHYSDEMDKMLKSQMTDIGYNQEVCLVGDTLVKTKSGSVKIKDLDAKSIIYDKEGLEKPVWQKPRVTGVKDTYLYKTSDKDIFVECTPDHKFPDYKNNKVEIQILKYLQVFNYSNDLLKSRINQYTLEKELYGIGISFEDYLSNCHDNHIAMRIVSSEYTGKKEVYNLGVDTEDTSYLLSNGIRTFNCAEFGSDADGVYPISSIEQSTVEEELAVTKEEVIKNRRDYTLIMGVDWNDDAVGTKITVLSYNKLFGKFIIVERASVGKEGWTPALAVEKIVLMNREYNLDYIYVDEGFGKPQATNLRLFAMEQYGKVPPNHPDLKLSQVKSVSFGSSMTIRDPVSGVEMRKQTKQYMVESSVDTLIRGKLVLHKEKDAVIISQMKNYIVKSKTANGAKVFGARDAQVGDHDLDSLILALHGFDQEFSEYNLLTPIVGASSLIRQREGNQDDNAIVLSQSPNIILNTRDSILSNKFRTSFKNRNFKTRKIW